MKSINFRRQKNSKTDEVQVIPILKTVEKSNDPFCTTRRVDQRGIFQDVALSPYVPLLALT
jgi:hypothetical protein